jgi:hypothetical protein
MSICIPVYEDMRELPVALVVNGALDT